MASGGDFDGDEFSNNLFSDLAPLLTLFGEEVTKQFLSMSMGWADNILLAIGPLGIITIIVSSIRVGGGKRLKTLIGRAREPKSTAEQELLSSTSENVCELWNGKQIVRLIGDTEGAKTFLISEGGAVFDLHSGVQNGLVETGDGLVNKHAEERLFNPTPNLSLNTRNATVSPFSLWFFAAFGFVLQLAALAFPGIATYFWDWQKASFPVAGYAYPCFCMGILCLSMGTMLCGHVIEGVTSEHKVSLTETGRIARLKFFSLQRAQKVGEEQYPTCVLFMAEHDHILRTSRLNEKS
ncbi:hypothetical protein CGCTS75_v006169 [Colletotrichum tropicale]|nr:hypothetical protein CGCTS75_v006169 [Colletotrichum tropicale]